VNPQRGHLNADLAQAFLDGRASAEDARTIEEHVHSCVECSQAFEEWRAVYGRLGHLTALEPSHGFATSVMERFQREAAFDAQGHLSADVLLDYLDGRLAAESVPATQSHLAACSDCAEQEQAWKALFGSIAGAGHHAPSTDFADSVLAAARVRAPQTVLGVPVKGHAPPGWIQTAVARLRNRDRKSLAVLAGLGTAPAVVLATLGWVVLTHPLVTTSGLFRFAWLKLAQFADSLTGAVVGGAGDSALIYALSSALEIVASAPGPAALGGLVVLLLMSGSTWVLFKNLSPIRETLNPTPSDQSLVRSNG